MIQNIICQKCYEMPKYWREVEFISANQNEDYFRVIKRRLCSKCINEIWEMIKKYLQEK